MVRVKGKNELSSLTIKHKLDVVLYGILGKYITTKEKRGEGVHRKHFVHVLLPSRKHTILAQCHSLVSQV